MAKRFAITLAKYGRSSETMELREKMLEASQRTLGSEHPDILSAMNNLAFNYSDLGRKQEAMKLTKKVLKASQRTLGNEHPDILDETVAAIVNNSFT